MRRRRIQLTIGDRYGRLVVDKLIVSGSGIRERHTWFCRCDCGNTIEVMPCQLVHGDYVSCGCKRREAANTQAAIARNTRHGGTGTLTHTTWNGMRARCTNPRSHMFRFYGARGIRVCERWCGPEGFANFLADMGEKPGPGYSIDRIDSNGHYEPGNCRWATTKQQARNTSHTKLDEVAAMQIRWLRNEAGYSVKEIGNAFCVSDSTVSGIARGRTWID